MLHLPAGFLDSIYTNSKHEDFEFTSVYWLVWTISEKRLWYNNGFYLLIVFDLIFSAAAVRVRGLPPHQSYALLLDLLCSQLTDQWWCYKEGEKHRERERGRRGMSLGISSLIQYKFNSLKSFLKDIRNSLYSLFFTQSWMVQAKVKGGLQWLLYILYIHCVSRTAES